MERNGITDSTELLSFIAVLGISYFGLVILLLSLLTTEFNPFSQVASDYGIGRFATEMNLGFFVGGIGMIAFAISLRKTNRSFRATPVLLTIAGLVLIMDSYFTTNPEGAPATLHGTIHGFGGLFFFITAPIGVLLVSRKFGLGRFLIILFALIFGFGLLFANAGVSGLGERVILLVIFFFGGPRFLKPLKIISATNRPLGPPPLRTHEFCCSPK